MEGKRERAHPESLKEKLRRFWWDYQGAIRFFFFIIENGLEKLSQCTTMTSFTYSEILKLCGEALGESSLPGKQYHLCEHFTIFSCKRAIN